MARIPVGFVMCLLNRVLVGGVYQAKSRTTDFVKPIRYEPNTIFALGFQVLSMRHSTGLATGAFRVVTVH